MGNPKIYAACLASYNAGVLFGEWIDADQSADDIKAAIAEMLASSPTEGAEEYAIHDYEGFGSLATGLGEWPDMEVVSLHGRMIEEHNGAWIAYCDYVGTHHATEDNFRDRYSGQWDSAEAYCEQLQSDCGIDLGPLANYIDWERYARDLEIGDGYYFADDGCGGVYVFTPG